MALITFPAVLPSSGEFGLVSNTWSHSSPFNGATQTLEMPGARWAGKMNFNNLTDAKSRLMQSFLMKMRGGANRFYFGDPMYNGALGIATGTPVVAGGSQVGSVLETSGWTISQTGIVKAGDYISYDTSEGRQLHMITADANSDGSGLAALSIESPIRTSPTDGQTIIVVDPTCQMRIVQKVGNWGFAGHSYENGLLKNFTLDFIESFV